MGIEQWSPTAANNVNANTGINWDEGQAPSTVNNSSRDTMAAIREWYEDAEWIKLGENGSATAYSISFVSTTVFKFAGTDRRSITPTGRRVKAGVGAGNITGTIATSSLSASDTQVTVTWDGAGVLDASLSSVSLGILSPTNDSHPRDMDMSFSDVAIKGALTFAAGASIGSIPGSPDASLSDVVITGTITLTAGTTASTFTFNGSGGSSGSVTMSWNKIGNWVLINLPVTTATSGTGSTVLASDTALPAAIRPAATQSIQCASIVNNAAAVAGPGLIQITTGGVVNILRDSIPTAYTNTALAGLGLAMSFAYYVG